MEGHRRQIETGARPACLSLTGSAVERCGWEAYNVTNDVSAATGGSSIAAASGSDGAQNVAASAATVTPPAAALNLAMQVGDCLLSAGMSANDVVVAMLGITDAYGQTRVHVDVTYTSISASYYPARGRCRSPASEWYSRMTLITARYVRLAS
jgi:hypothetical protein